MIDSQRWRSADKQSLQLQYALSLRSLPGSSFLQGALNLQNLFFLQYASFFFLLHGSSPSNLPFLWPYWAKLIALPMVYIEPKTHNKSVQISIQMHWNRLHTLNSTAIPPTCLQEGVYLRFLLQSQKSGWVSRRIVIRQIIQRTFSTTLLVMYSPSFLANEFLPAIRFTYTYVSCVIAGVG